MNRSRPPVAEHPSPILNLNNKHFKRSNPLLPLFSPVVLSILPYSPSLKYIICIAAHLSLSRSFPSLHNEKLPAPWQGIGAITARYLLLKPHLNDHARFCRSKPPLTSHPPPFPTILGPERHTTPLKYTSHNPTNSLLAAPATRINARYRSFEIYL